MNFNKSFEMSPEMRNLLPSQNRSKKPTKNFVMENIRSLRAMQLQMEATKKALEDKNLQKAKLKVRSPFTSVKGVNQPVWLRCNLTSEEKISLHPVEQSTIRPSHGEVEQPQGVQISKRLIDQGVQTSPPRITSDVDTLQESPAISKQLRSPLRPNETAIEIKKKAINKVLKENGVNFVELNKRIEYKPKLAKGKFNQAGIPPGYQLGEIPRYLQDRKKPNPSEKEDSMLDIHIPWTDVALEDDHRPGYVLLSDDERLEHLKIMNKCYEELVVQFNQLPIRSDSLKAKQKRADLEHQLDNLEKSMKLFSREKLYIKL